MKSLILLGKVNTDVREIELLKLLSPPHICIMVTSFAHIRLSLHLPRTLRWGLTSQSLGPTEVIILCEQSNQACY